VSSRNVRTGETNLDVGMAGRVISASDDDGALGLARDEISGEAVERLITLGLVGALRVARAQSSRPRLLPGGTGRLPSVRMEEAATL
jgi:hypothetical protein